MEYFKYMWQCLAVGVVAGALAGFVLRGKHTFLGDVIVGVIGALLGGYLFSKLEMAVKAGVVGTALFAAIGAVVCLVGWRALGTVDR